jgi:capsular polysaccharide biosynthesis protein
MSGPGTFSRREVRISVLAGAVAAVLVVLAGAGLALVSQPKWTAESVLVVLPSADLDTSDSASYYETLSRGQIVATFAEVADDLQERAEQKLQLSDAQRAGVSTTVSVVPDTSVILIRSTAGTAAVAEQLADATTSVATGYLAGLSQPYRTELVRGAAGTAVSSGTSPMILLALAFAVALLVGVAVQQAVYHLMMTARAAKERTARAAGPAPPDGARDAHEAAPPDGAGHRTGDDTAGRARDEARVRESVAGPHGS